MFGTKKWYPALASVLVVAAALSGCDDSEVVAPDGSTITLSGNPAQIVLSNGVQSIPVELIATVRSEIGVPLPGQDVRFDTTSGVLNPVVGTPVSTDSFGNARCTLTLATSGPTITATSGTTSDTLTLTAATGLLATIQLTPSQVAVSDCGDNPVFTATALDPDGEPIQGVSIEIIVTNSGQATVPIITFPDSPGTTDAMGEVTFTLTFNTTDCNTKCATGKTCEATFQARNLGQTVTSNFATLTDAIP